ncbi:MAG: toxic anion resistance protein [Gammaproteobacteria bacterium]|nr:MAG: toxic anion resistance protein [Gammaproteobacteria bacterium]
MADSRNTSTTTAVAEATGTDIFGPDELLPGQDLLPVPSEDVHRYDDVDTAQRAQIDRLMQEINLADSNSIIFFGSKAQQQLTTVSDNMLEGVRNKDVGSAGQSLNNMVTVLRGFQVEDFDPNERPGFFTRLWRKLFGGLTPVAKFVQQYEGVRRQVDAVTDDLEGHKTRLLKDITSLDKLYEANLQYFHDLESYIIAGEQKLAYIDDEMLPAAAASAENTDEVLPSQELRDLRSARDDLERRIHDLKLTRQVAMQGLPSIRLIQENDKGLVNKINSTLVNTVPLWRQQLAQAVTIFRSGEAAKSVKRASDLTNELLEKNAENLRSANRTVREEIERGVFDVNAVRRANDNLIATIEESLQIADEGKRRRHEAEVQLENMESQLKDTLQQASARKHAGAEV